MEMKVSPGNWFAHQVEANTEALLWAATELPPERVFAVPPAALGTWPAARHYFHLLCYEQQVALPSLRQWLGEPRPTFDGYDEDRAWGTGQPLEALLAALQETRRGLLQVLTSMPETAWREARDTVWGPQPRTFYWVASKTYQHAVQHASDLLKLVIQWDHYASREGPRPQPGIAE